MGERYTGLLEGREAEVSHVLRTLFQVADIRRNLVLIIHQWGFNYRELSVKYGDQGDPGGSGQRVHEHTWPFAEFQNHKSGTYSNGRLQ